MKIIIYVTGALLGIPVTKTTIFNQGMLFLSSNHFLCAIRP